MFCYLLLKLCKQSAFGDILFPGPGLGIEAASILPAGDELGSNTRDIFPRVRTGGQVGDDHDREVTLAKTISHNSGEFSGSTLVLEARVAAERESNSNGFARIRPRSHADRKPSASAAVAIPRTVG